MYFIKEIEHIFGVSIASCKHSGTGRILESYADPQLCLGLAQLSRILPTLLMFRWGYVNMEKVLYCLNPMQVLVPLFEQCLFSNNWGKDSEVWKKTLSSQIQLIPLIATLVLSAVIEFYILYPNPFRVSWGKSLRFALYEESGAIYTLKNSFCMETTWKKICRPLWLEKGGVIKMSVNANIFTGKFFFSLRFCWSALCIPGCIQRILLIVV